MFVRTCKEAKLETVVGKVAADPSRSESAPSKLWRWRERNRINLLPKKV